MFMEMPVNLVKHTSTPSGLTVLESRNTQKSPSCGAGAVTVVTGDTTTRGSCIGAGATTALALAGESAQANAAAAVTFRRMMMSKRFNRDD